MASIFTRIIQGEIPCYKVAEDKDHLGFLDVSPVNRGHTLVVPKVEVDKLYDLEETQYMALQAFARRVALAMSQSFDCNRIGNTVIGLEVPHVHIHLIPINTMSDMDFTKPKLQIDQKEMESIADLIASNFK